jgi:hypothetical protein
MNYFSTKSLLKLGISCFIFFFAATKLVSAEDVFNNHKIMKIVEPWKNITVKLVTAGFSGPPVIKSKTEELAAKQAVYQISPAPRPDRDKCSFLYMNDLLRKKKTFIEGGYPFYLSDDSGIRGVFVAAGVIIWCDSYFELTNTVSDEAAIKNFENNFDPRKAGQEFENKLTTNRIGLKQAVSRWYFSKSPSAGNALVDPQVESVDYVDNILKLDIRNPSTKIPATLWINLKEKKVIKSVVDGQEMDLNSGKPFAVPQKK